MRLVLLFALSAAAVPAQGPPVRVEATPAKTEVTVGEPFRVELTASGPEGASYVFPGELAQDQIELRAVAPAPPASGAAATPSAPPPDPGLQAYEAAVFGLGAVEIPPLTVRYLLADGREGEVRTAPVKLKVVSLLPKDAAEQKLADIRGPVGVTIGRAFWIALFSVAVLLGLLAFWQWRRGRKAAAPEVPALPEIAPDAEALRALERLVASGALVRGEMRPFYIALTAIAKRYLERRLGAPVQEMTSAEMVAFLRDHPIAGELAPPLRDLSSAADGVKFARGAGLVPEAERHLAAVGALVRSVEARLSAVEQPPPGRAA